MAKRKSKIDVFGFSVKLPAVRPSPLTQRNALGRGGHDPRVLATPPLFSTRISTNISKLVGSVTQTGLWISSLTPRGTNQGKKKIAVAVVFAEDPFALASRSVVLPSIGWNWHSGIFHGDASLLMWRSIEPLISLKLFYNDPRSSSIEGNSVL